MQKRIAFLTLIILTVATLALAQQDKSQRPSPPAQAECKFADGKSIKVDYSSPRTHDPKTHEARKIYGGLVPYGQVWRTGANEATTFVTDTDLTVGGKDIPAGSYTIFTIPNEDKWTLIISKSTGEWGIPYPGEANDFARVEMKVSKLSASTTSLTLIPIAPNSCWRPVISSCQIRSTARPRSKPSRDTD